MFQEISFIKSKKYASEKEISYSYLNNYLLNLFFKHQVTYLDSFIHSYGLKYGENASKYFRKASDKWMNESLDMSKQTIERALPIIFSILTHEDKEEIIVRERIIIIRDIINLYIREINDISKKSIVNNMNDLKKRLSLISEVLNRDELRESIYLSISDLKKRDNSKIASNIIKKSINYKIARLKQDLDKCSGYFNLDFPDSSSVKYTSAFFNLELDLLKDNPKRNNTPFNIDYLLISTISSDVYDSFLETFIVKESISNLVAHHVKKFDGEISEHDIGLFLKKYATLFKLNESSYIHAYFSGMEGNLRLSFTIYPSLVLRKQNFNHLLFIVFLLCFLTSLLLGLFSDIHIMLKLALLSLCAVTANGILSNLDVIKKNNESIRKNKLFMYGK